MRPPTARSPNPASRSVVVLRVSYQRTSPEGCQLAGGSPASAGGRELGGYNICRFARHGALLPPFSRPSSSPSPLRTSQLPPPWKQWLPPSKRAAPRTISSPATTTLCAAGRTDLRWQGACSTRSPQSLRREALPRSLTTSSSTWQPVAQSRRRLEVPRASRCPTALAPAG